MADTRTTWTYPSLRQRLIALFVYGGLLYLIGALLTGSWVPTGGGQWAWWLSAIALYLVTMLQAPFFHTPRDALANAIAAVLILLMLDLSVIETGQAGLNIFRWAAVALSLLTIIAAITDIRLHPVSPTDLTWRGNTQQFAHKFATKIGNGVVMFTPPALISIFGFHQHNPFAMLWLAFLWVLIVTIKPVELAIEVWNTVRQVKLDKPSSDYVGLVTRVDDPNIIRVNLASSSSWQHDRLHTARLPGDRYVNVIPLFVQPQNNELIGTGLCCDGRSNDSIAPGHVWTASGDRSAQEVIQQLTGENIESQIIGFVVEDSNISRIRFEVASTVHIEEGTVVFVRDRNLTIYYQILDAATKEEVFTQNPRGTHIVTASQLGTLEDGAFKKYGWVPPMNAPVFLPKKIEAAATTAESETDEFTLGGVAQTGIAIKASLRDAADYHTAVLGVTGTGKTELVLDMVEAHVKAGRKVFCVDCTGEYEPRLKARLPATSITSVGFDQAAVDKLDELVNATEHGQYSAADEKKALHDWVVKNREDVGNTVADFMTSDTLKVGIFDLPDIANTRASLRATEMYISAIFAWARENRKARDLVVVLEEAHTVVPEANLYRFDKADTDAVVGRMSQIALQGRKYGVGLLLVSQRTALVSKTLLSQCNTCICFAMYDKTGLDYLASVFASDHVRAIPNLRFLQGIAFGKAIKSDRPIIFEIPFDQAKKDASEVLNKTLDTPNDEGQAKVADNGSTTNADDDFTF